MLIMTPVSWTFFLQRYYQKTNFKKRRIRAQIVSEYFIQRHVKKACSFRNVGGRPLPDMSIAVFSLLYIQA